MLNIINGPSILIPPSGLLLILIPPSKPVPRSLLQYREEDFYKSQYCEEVKCRGRYTFLDYLENMEFIRRPIPHKDLKMLGTQLPSVETDDRFYIRFLNF